MNSGQIISFSVLTDEGRAELIHALFEMVDGSVVMTPCDAEGNTLIVNCEEGN